ncbi:sensor domain-containing diguanylate cyclase [Methylomicrobium sp. RS1]|uniref:sensor domain-containing diguanylate cyclase n=1 Tax=Candidatus Methylomicrobium oryzae TaxID=2802053 RepID=UPI0019243A59|nr:HDOD domain-containing protein [Methylomicrobium sp. RS1]MBL1262095.1 HDOD domain-containing protein [Methylomicrobium sp. RS1]
MKAESGLIMIEMDNKLEHIKKAAKAILKNESLNLQLVPAIAVKLVNLTYNPDVRIEALAKIIETDPALAVKVLQTINSAAFCLPAKVTSISRSVNLLGVDEVRRIALTMLLFSKMIQRKSDQFDCLFFWQHCLFVAELSRRIASALQYPDPEMVYAAGLLHDIGKLALEVHGKLTYSQFIGSLHNSSHPLLEEEMHFFGITHAEMGLALCLEWQLPMPITGVVSHHHVLPDPGSPFYPYRTEIAIVAFANYIASLQGISSTSHTGPPQLSPLVFEWLPVDELELDGLMEETDKAMRAARQFYRIEFPDTNRLRAKLLQASIAMSRSHHTAEKSVPQAAVRNISGSLTAPHQSLEPADFVPWTLESIRHDFDFDRVLLFRIDPQRRSLVASHAYPEVGETGLEIDIGRVSGKLLHCLREKTAVLIHASLEPENPLIRQFDAAEFIAVPVLSHYRLAGIIYADYGLSRKPINARVLEEIVAVAAQLGVALANAKHYEMQKHQAQLDSLTRIYNRGMLEFSLSQICRRPAGELQNVALGFVDIDRFKLFNDRCGHQKGDEIIRLVADMLKRLTRPGDLVGRFGGEEFLFVLTDTNENDVRAYAERIRSEIELRGKTMKPRFRQLDLTVSIGVVLYRPNFGSYHELIDAADQAMYRAKMAGRNRVVLFDDFPAGDGMAACSPKQEA